MRTLLNPLDRDRLLGLLRHRMVVPVTLHDTPLRALTEGEDGKVCELRGNALAAELFAQPEVRDADPDLADDLLDFVMAMTDAPMPCRRMALGGLDIRRDDPRAFEILTPFHRFAGDLSSGILMQWLHGRVHGMPGSALAPLLHTGNMAEFRIGRRSAHVDAEDGIRAFGLERQDDSVLLWHETPIAGRAGLLRGQPVEAGVLRYEYRISGTAPVLGVTVRFTASHAMSQLRLTTALDVLDGPGLDLAEGAVQFSDGWRAVPPPATPGSRILAENVAVAHVALGQSGWPAGGPTLHLRPSEPARVMNARIEAGRPGVLHWLLLRHGPEDLGAGASMTLAEERLFACGIEPEAAARAMLMPRRAGLDLDPLPPSGAALVAVATHLLLARAGAYRLGPNAAQVSAREAWFDRQMTLLVAGSPDSEDLALALLGLELRLRAGGQGPLAGWHADVAERLLARQGPEGGFGQAGLVAQAAAILALAQSARRLGAASQAALSRALAALYAAAETILVAGSFRDDRSRHAEGLGLLARALSATLIAAEDGSLALPQAERQRAVELHRQVIGLMRPLVQPRDAFLEVHASALGGGASPASQAGVTLGLLAPEALTLRLADSLGRPGTAQPEPGSALGAGTAEAGAPA
jgi:hypothetical protein